MNGQTPANRGLSQNLWQDPCIPFPENGIAQASAGPAGDLALRSLAAASFIDDMLQGYVALLGVCL